MELSRRAFMRLTGGALLFTGGILAAVRTSGYPETKKLKALRAWEYALVAAAARRIVLPDAPDMPTADDVSVAEYVDRYVAELPPRARRDLGQLFAYLEHLAPVRGGYATRFTRLEGAAQDRVLEQLEAVDEALLRGAFAGLKSLVMMGYYRSEKTWAALGYTGPFVTQAVSP